MLHNSHSIVARKARTSHRALHTLVLSTWIFLALAAPKAKSDECLDKIPHVQAALNAAKERRNALLALPADCSKAHVDAALALTGAASFAVTSARTISGCALGVANENIREAQNLFMMGSSVITSCNSKP